MEFTWDNQYLLATLLVSFMASDLGIKYTFPYVAVCLVSAGDFFTWGVLTMALMGVSVVRRVGDAIS